MSTGEKFPVTRTEVDELKEQVRSLESRFSGAETFSADALSNTLEYLQTQIKEVRKIAIQASVKVPILSESVPAENTTVS